MCSVVHGVVVGVSCIAKTSPVMAHQASQNLNDIRHAALAYTLCGMSAHTAGQSSSPPPNPSPLLMISRQTSPRRPMLSPRCSRSCLATTKSRKHVARKVRKRLGQKGAETRGRLQWPRCPLRHADSSCASPRFCAKIPTICFWTPRVHSMKYTSSTQMSVKRGGPAFGPMFLWACQLMP